MGLIKDVIFFIGLGLMVYGVFLLSLPASICLAGFFMALLAVGFR